MTIAFLVWVLVMGVALVVLVVLIRRSKSVDDIIRKQTDSSLLQIRRIAEKRHIKKYGRPPTQDWDSQAKK